MLFQTHTTAVREAGGQRHCHRCHIAANGALAGMAKVLEPVLLKVGSDVVVKVRANTPVQDLLQQLEKACRDGRTVDHEGYDVTQHYAQDLPGGEYQVITSAASKLVACCCVTCQYYTACTAQHGTYTTYGGHLQTNLF